MCGIDSPLYRFGLCLNKMFDTMASGKPGICALGVKSYFSEYGCGYDIASDDTEASCRKIKEIRSFTAEDLKKTEEISRKACTERFNYTSLANEFLSVMEE